MPVPSTFADLSTTPASNSPAGSDSPTVLDDHQRTLYAFIASIYANSGNGWSSPYLPTASPTYTGTLTGGTGVVNIGSGQVYKDSSGNVGLGTTSPSNTLHLATSNARLYIAPSLGTNGAWTQYTNTGGNAYVGIDSSAGSLNAAYALNIYHSGAYPIVMSTSGTARLTVKSTGQVKFAPLSSAPSGAEEGDIYYDSTAKKHYGYNGTSWNALY